MFAYHHIITDSTPIELVWGHAKGAVARRNVSYNLKKAMTLMREEFLKCDAEYWK